MNFKNYWGQVRKVIHKPTGNVFAVKILKKNRITPEDKLALLQEIEIMKIVNHPNIIKIVEYYDEPSFLFIVMEFCNGGKLFDRKITVNDENISRIAQQILSPINYAHNKKIVLFKFKQLAFTQVHRDLKPQNILYEKKESDSDLKIIDWGLSCFFKDNEKFDEMIGTLLFMSPEIIMKNFDEKCDIWAIGIILFMQITDTHPFQQGKNTTDLLEKIKDGKINYNLYDKFNNVSEDCKQFIQWLLMVDPLQRPSAQQALNCEWMKKYQKN